MENQGEGPQIYGMYPSRHLLFFKLIKLGYQNMEAQTITLHHLQLHA
jgi:hypothetical protein